MHLLLSCLATVFGFALSIQAANPPARPPPFRLWPATAPGEKGDIGEEKDLTKESDGLIAGRRLIRLGNVSEPTLTVYPAPAAQRTGSAVLVCPGGAYHILALDLEGTEVCEWLNSMGVTAALLKYRVPRRAEVEKHAPALQDAQRAMSLLRTRAKEWSVDPDRIGVMGFSAGGHLSAALSTATQRTYDRLDATDDTSFKPAFASLIYPGYLTVKEANDKVAPELTVSSNTPPTFLLITQDDPVRMENALYYAAGLQRHKVPLELHVYPKGGHGYGLRRTKDPVTTWPDRMADWMRAHGW
ncbi:MAG: alpha/beta hydrolase [Verrucomicrobia bacterium]|nr:alpha/beta hydrolase [Verrucomicrobiota bacterium]